ncbi:uncharacterized protein F5891DRAFT_1190616 [Suillus fuscotomentosus]|uniref:Uncharacterized protein n=1 Tax=Suillus fuscotomentosus TaxID=1912939 RepID=A0AAD4E3E6_9AGAM|nr:uncharacterized protein F5891DRAFT_1190616 [Suillus fuscotomentosus]KAG1898546.1 hypothetical protein F5891DRAFT_1190616 [Suillus fuscotomentosus]
MPLPSAVQDFLDLSLDPDLDDLDNGYQADTSLDSNDTRSSTPVMTLSDDLVANPACWPSSHALRIRARLVSFMDLPPVTHVATSTTESVMESESEPEVPSVLAKTTPIPPPPKYEPSSVTEPESDIEELPQPSIKNLPKNEPSSVTEPESDVEDLPQPLPQPSIKSLPKNDPSSVTEPESDVENLPIKTPIKKKSFFDTPSPPGPDSCYWKYVSREEDAKWYDRAHADNSFLTVRQIKQDLKDLH